MKILSLKRIILATLGFCLIVAPAKAQLTLLPTGSIWKYLDDGSDQGTAWRAPGFVDGNWLSGPAELGFGDGFEATTNAAGHITYYYRTTFTVEDTSSITNLRARLKRDDGAVIYLNGVEVVRDNMPAGSIAFDTLAATTAADDGATFFPHSFSASALVNGDNVLAVEVHQSATTSSDISFDLELVGNPLPQISISSPTNGQTIAASSVIIQGTGIPGGSNVTFIEVFEGNNKIGESTSASFNIVMPNVTPGSYTLTARVLDSSGLRATSAPVNITVQAPPASLLVSRGSDWKYHNLGQDLGTVWRESGYDDGAANGWAGPLPGPIGDNNEGGVQMCASVIAFGPTGGRFPTLYFRRSFNVSHANAYQGLILRIVRDDAVAIYLNGQQLYGTEGITFPTSFGQFSTYTAAGADESVYQGPFNVPSSALVEGQNVIAVECKNVNLTSSDIAFDLEVEGVIDTAPPVVVSSDPPPNAIVTELTFVSVLFDTPVAGVDASDLLVNNEPATSLLVISPRQYQFNFPAPATGTVQIAWAANHGITDTAPLQNAFSGDGWSYILNPHAGQGAQMVISEFMANNNTGIRDPLDGKRSDWIELFNGGSVPVDLNGWFLTDDSANLTKWRFSSLVMQPNAYLLVWASGDSDPTRPLHTNFKLSSSSNYLALVDARTNIVSAFDPYPNQQADISYGRDRVDPSVVGFFSSPTPGSQNLPGGPGFMGPPVFSIESGVFTNDSLTLTISGPIDGTIRYTTDGTNPTNTSPAYTGPISITGNTAVKARVYPPATTNLFPSIIVAKTYVLLDASIRDFNSNLPVLIMDTRLSLIPADVLPGGNRAKGTFVVFPPVGGRTSLREPPELQATAEFERFGQTSISIWGPNAKMPYNIEIQDASGNDEEHSILGLPADADWKLRPAWEKSLMNDFLAFELFEQMGDYSVRRKHVEVFVHQGPGKLTAADYGGIEVLLEKIEIAGNRVDVQKLTTAMTSEPDISGGYIFKKDKDSAGDLNFTTSGANGVSAQILKFHDPKPRELSGTPGGTAQQNYLKNFLNAMERALGAANFTTATGTNHYSYYMDVDAFVDQFWIVEFPKQIDGYRLSDYFSKDRNGKVRPVPIWDWNLAFGNANYLDGGRYANWYWNQTGGGDYPWAKRLITGSTAVNTGVGGDPDFCQKIADRWAVLRTNVMNGPRVSARIDEIAANLTEAATRPAPLGDFTKPAYARLGVSQWPEPNGAPGGWDVDYVNLTSYPAIISDVKKWAVGRYNWIDSLFLPPPNFNQPGGMVTNGTTITLSVTPGATNYYTLDGTDPRAAGGNLAAGALMYTGPITINANARIFARARMANSGSATVRPFQNTWSGPAVATFFTSLAPLRITEIMYNPAALVGNTNNNDNFEYIEVQNIGGTSLNVNRFSLGGGVQFQFPDALLTNGEYAVIVKDINAFQLRYGTNTVRILGTYTGSLANTGDRLILSGPLQEPIQDFSYLDAWYRATDGAGFSLVLKDANAPPSLAASWRASAGVGGSPGAVDPVPPARPAIVINEVRSYADPLPDAIELYNPTASDVNIGGWFLTDDFNKPMKFTFGPGTIIAAGGYRTFTETNFNSDTNDPNSFAFGSKGDSVYLFSGNGLQISGYVHGFDFGVAEFGVDFGRYVDSTGDDHFLAQRSATLGATNSGPLIGPIVISEIMYHPPDLLVGPSGLNNETDEFIELQNITAGSVALYDATRPTNTWRLREGVDFDFPMNITIPAGGFAFVVGFDPVANPSILAAFRQRNLVPADLPVYGPWHGALPNDGGQIELSKPRGNDTNASVPYVLVERIKFSDTAPWPVYADGIGLSLQRIVPASYGNDPTNWVAVAPSPGANYVAGATAPAITSQPAGREIIAGNDATFSVSATGTQPLRYQWKYNGFNLPGATNANLVYNNFQLSQAGVYNVMVFNAGGYALGTNFTITSRVGLRITAQPQSRVVFVGATTNFTVAAVGSGPILYQWYFNGNPIPTNNPTATNATLTLTNIQPSAEGSYYVTLRDDFENTISDVVSLLVVARPVFSQVPVAATVVEGGTAVFTASATGTAPMYFNWRTNGSGLVLPNATIIRNPTNSVLILSNVSLTFSNYQISATITNIGGNQIGGIPTARLFVLPDSDHDGLPDSWEATHTGNANDGAFDSDGDTMSNAAEYIAGTDSLDPASNLKVQTIAPGLGRLQFTAVSNRTYTVQYTDKLNPPTWNKLADVLARTVTRTEVITDLNATTNRFYRLVIPIQQ